MMVRKYMKPSSREMLKQVSPLETYEEAVRKQAALAEQARLKEQAAKEQESKAKSIKDKQQPKDNPNKKSKPWAYCKSQGKVSSLIADFLAELE